MIEAWYGISVIPKQNNPMTFEWRGQPFQIQCIMMGDMGEGKAISVLIDVGETVYVPAKDAAGVTESGKAIVPGSGVEFLRTENSAAVYAVGSGTYRFQSSLPDAVN